MQSSSLSTYIGYITGPRAEQPVGVRVVEPTPGSRQYQRGSLYIVVEVVGDHPDRHAIVDRLLSEVQRVYYSAKGSQSQVMVEAVQQTQQLLREINAHTPHYPMQLGTTCAALLGGKLLVASSGPAFALMRVSERVHMFPSEPNMAAPNTANFGQVPIEVYRQDVQADDAVFLGGGGWLRRVPTRTLASIVAFTNADNCSDAADELYDQAGQMQVPGLLIVLGAGNNNEPPRGGHGSGGYSGGGGYPSRPSSGAGPSGGTSRPPASRRPRFGGLPTSVHSAPPARLPPSQMGNDLPSTGGARPQASTAHRAQSQVSTTQVPASQLRSGQGIDSAPGSEVGTSLVEQQQPPPQRIQPRSAPPALEPDLPADGMAHSEETSGEASARHERQPLEEPPVEDHPHATQLSDDQLIDKKIGPIATGAAIDERLPDAAARTESPARAEETPPDRPVDDAPTTQPYPISPLEDASFGGDLPVEPDEDIDPIFPPSTVQSSQETGERTPSLLQQLQAGAGAGVAATRGFFSRVMPKRQQAGNANEWEEISDELIPPKPPRPRFNELAAQQEQAAARSVAPAVSDEDDFDDEEMDADARQVEAPTLEVTPLVPPSPTRGARARLFLLIALVIAILVPVVVLAVNLGQGNSNRAEAEQLTARAEIVLLGAQSALDQGDKVTARERLTEAEDYLAQAIELDGVTDHRSQLIATIESELQEVLQVTPLYGLTVPLIIFPPDARPQKVLVMNDDIFVIDAGRQALLQYRYDQATGTVDDQLGQVLLSQGQQIGNVTVGTLADMGWLPLIPGFEDRPSLLITDRNNNVFRYDQRVEGATVMEMADRSAWGSIGQVQTYNGRVYLADEARGSILRYNPGEFGVGSTPWFAAETPVNLAGLLSMEIDGDIWLLFSNGSIMRYREGEQLPFSPEISTALAEEPTDMFVTRQGGAYIYVVDAGQDRILVYDKQGAYIAQLQAPEEDLLRGLSGLYIDEVGSKMFILTQTGLFSHPVLP